MGPLMGTEKDKKLQHNRRIQKLAQSDLMDHVLEMARHDMKDSEAQPGAQVDDSDDPLVDKNTDSPGNLAK
ncbi:hypothetical protein E8E14_000027 [Neopestalotiopsis sp. 37M]|nr:hypothetical protein E8E14_000027 [Neopestalotiopsis sp. 37M]